MEGRQNLQTKAAALPWAPLTVAVDRHVVGLLSWFCWRP